MEEYGKIADLFNSLCPFPPRDVERFDPSQNLSAIFILLNAKHSINM